MNVKYRLFILLIGFSLLSCSNSKAELENAELKTKTWNSVDFTSPELLVLGANYVERNENSIRFSRFNPELYSIPTNKLMFNADKAKTNSGIRLRFKTSASKVEFKFVLGEGINRGSEFALFEEDKLVESIYFNQKESQDSMILSFGLNANSVHELSLPSLSNVELTNMSVYGGNLEMLKDNRPTYFALGNSITHGVGQGSASHLTYPFLLAQKLNYNYYNLAVGGAKIAQHLAVMTSELPQADIITYLIGYNDLHFNNKLVEDYVSDYKNFILELRKHQTSATIYCISLTHTRSQGNDKTGITPDDYRGALKTLIQELQISDNRLVFVEGDKITSEANLRSEKPTDKVHFGVEGAAFFADELYKIIRKK